MYTYFYLLMFVFCEENKRKDWPKQLYSSHTNNTNKNICIFANSEFENFVELRASCITVVFAEHHANNDDFARRVASFVRCPCFVLFLSCCVLVFRHNCGGTPWGSPGDTVPKSLCEMQKDHQPKFIGALGMLALLSSFDKSFD